MVYKIKTSMESSVIGLSGLNYDRPYTIATALKAICKHSAEYQAVQDKMINELTAMSKIHDIVKFE